MRPVLSLSRYAAFTLIILADAPATATVSSASPTTDHEVVRDPSFIQLRHLVGELREILGSFRPATHANNLIQPPAQLKPARVRIVVKADASESANNQVVVTQAPDVSAQNEVTGRKQSHTTYEKIDATSETAAETNMTFEDAQVVAHNSVLREINTALSEVETSTKVASSKTAPAVEKPATASTPDLRAQTSEFVSRPIEAPALTREECLEQLAKLDVSYTEVAQSEVPGAAFPVKIDKLSADLEIKTKDNKIKSIMDCRLAVALSKAIMSLYRHSVSSVDYLSVFRENAHVRGGDAVSGHAKGLAMDVSGFRLADGTELSVLKDWGSVELGSAPCPNKLSDEKSKSARLRDLVCEIAEQGVFNVVLTPHFDQAHANHIHLEVKPDVNWLYLR